MITLNDIPKIDNLERPEIEIVYVNANVESSGVFTIVKPLSSRTRDVIGPGFSGIDLFSPARFSLRGERTQWKLGFSYKVRDLQEEPINLFDLDRSEFFSYSLGLEWTQSIGSPYRLRQSESKVFATKKPLVPFIAFGIQHNTYKIFGSNLSSGYSSQGMSYSSMIGFENTNRARFGIRWSVHPNSGPLSFSSLAFEFGGIL
ncbi:MAG: hypothetical protein WCK51_13205 [Armatimonadota bacterium]